MSGFERIPENAYAFCSPLLGGADLWCSRIGNGGSRPGFAAGRFGDPSWRFSFACVAAFCFVERSGLQAPTWVHCSLAGPALAFGALNLLEGPLCSHRVNHGLLPQREPQGEGLQTVLQRRKKRVAALLRSRQHPTGSCAWNGPALLSEAACGGSPTGG
jgi:hypothetical protein